MRGSRQDKARRRQGEGRDRGARRLQREEERGMLVRERTKEVREGRRGGGKAKERGRSAARARVEGRESRAIAVGIRKKVSRGACRGRG